MVSIKPWQADLLLLLAALSWGTTFALVQNAVKDVPVYTFLFWRFGFAFVLMLPVVLRQIGRLDMDTIKAASVLGLFNFGAYAFQTFGLTLTLSSTVAFITGLFVVLVPMIAYLIFRQPVAKAVWIASLMALVGLWLLTLRGPIGVGLGEAYALICAVLFALHVIYTDRFSRRYSVPMLVTFQFGTMATGSALMGLIHDHTLLPPSFSSAFVTALFITVVFATIFAFWVQTSMQRHTTPGRTALIFTMEPLSAAVFGYFYLGETLSIGQLTGGLLIVAGVLFAELGS
jgi:drug/metabolite transporter (DMT)-like permease